MFNPFKRLFGKPTPKKPRGGRLDPAVVLSALCRRVETGPGMPRVPANQKENCRWLLHRVEKT